MEFDVTVDDSHIQVVAVGGEDDVAGTHGLQKADYDSSGVPGAPVGVIGVCGSQTLDQRLAVDVAGNLPQLTPPDGAVATVQPLRDHAAFIFGAPEQPGSTCSTRGPRLTSLRRLRRWAPTLIHWAFPECELLAKRRLKLSSDGCEG